MGDSKVISVEQFLQAVESLRAAGVSCLKLDGIEVRFNEPGKAAPQPAARPASATNAPKPDVDIEALRRDELDGV